MRYFSACKSIEDVKETFKRLAKELHPDNGGDAEQFKAMMNEYTVAFNRYKNVHRKDQDRQESKDNGAENRSNSRAEYQESPEEFAEIINKVIFMDGVEIEIVGRWVWLSGNTYFYKDQIKEAGFMWSSKHRKWFWNGGERKSKKHSNLTYEQVKNLHGCQKVKSGSQARLSA